LELSRLPRLLAPLSPLDSLLLPPQLPLLVVEGFLARPVSGWEPLPLNLRRQRVDFPLDSPLLPPLPPNRGPFLSDSLAPLLPLPLWPSQQPLAAFPLASPPPPNPRLQRVVFPLGSPLPRLPRPPPLAEVSSAPPVLGLAQYLEPPQPSPPQGPSPLASLRQ